MTEPITTKRVLLTPASQIKTRRQKWFWEPTKGSGVIPLGTATIAAGKGGEGKTTFMLDLAARGSRGKLHGDVWGQKIATIIIGPEDDWDTIMVPRLKAAGADLDRIYKIDVETTIDDLDPRLRSLKFPLDVDMIAEAVNETGAKMVLVDPAPSLMHGDMNKVQDVRMSYEPLIALAQREELALILINHFGKGGGSVSAKLSGSHAWRDLTRSYLAFATDEETGERVFSQDKGNYSETLGSYKFALESVDVTTDDGETASVARVDFLGETDQTVGDIINRDSFSSDEGSTRSEATEWLLAFLDREPWEFSRAAVMKAARSEGYSEGTMKRAKDDAVVSHGRTNAVPSSTIWRHPSWGGSQSAQHSAQTDHRPRVRELTEPTGLTVDSRGFKDEQTGGSTAQSVQLAQLARPRALEPTDEPTEHCKLHPTPIKGCWTCDSIAERKVA